MENYINQKDAKIMSVKGEIYSELLDNTLLQVGDFIEVGAVLNLVEGSEIVLAFSDGTQQRVYSYEGESTNEIRVDIISNNGRLESVDNSDINNIQNEISDIQDLIVSEDDIELSETAAGLVSNEGTRFVATVSRTGDETLAQAGYDTVGQDNNFPLFDGLDTEINSEQFFEINNGNGSLILTDGDEVVSTVEDTTLTGNVLTNASSPDGPLSVTDFTVDGTTYVIGTTASLTEGDLTLNSDGSYTFVPSTDYNGGVPVVTYTVTDGAGDTDISTLTISVGAASDLIDDNEVVSTVEDTTLTGNVLTNASSPDGPLSVTDFTVDGTTYVIGTTASLTEGDLTLNSDGSYTFVPSTDYNGGVPVVTYTVTDGAGDTDISTLTISVGAASDLIDDNEVVSTVEDTTLTGNVLTNASSPDGPLSVTDFTVDGTTYVIGTTASLTEGDLTLNSDGSYTFVPSTDYNGGVPVVTYTVTDGAGDTDISTLTISVGAASDLIDDNEVVSTVEDTTLTGNVLTNASSPDGPLSVTDFTVDGTTYVIGTTASLTEGDLTLNSDGSYTFVPSTDYNGGVPVVTYTVTDGAGDTDISTLTISVGAASDLIDDNEVVSTVEDTTLTGNVLTNASSPDGPLSVTDFTVDGTTYVIGTTASLTEGDLTLNSDGSYTFVPSTDYNGGVPVVTYTVTDGAGDTDISTLTISVGAASDLIDDNEVVSTVEDTTLTGNVLTNASSPDGPLSVTDFTVDGTTYVIGTTASLTEGDLTLNSDGSYTFVPSTDYNGGVPVVTYTVTDGAGDTDISTLTISVGAASDLIDDNEVVSTVEDTTLTGNVLTNASSPDGPLSVTDFTVDGTTYVIGTTASLTEGDLTLNSDGSYTFVPSTDYNGGVPVVTYTVTDGAGDTDISTLTISVGAASDLIDDNEVVSTVEDTTLTGNVLTNASSPDGPLSVTDFTVDGTTYVIGTTASLTEGDLTLNSDGSYTFVPSTDYNGGVPVVTYTVTDGAGDTDISTLTISVGAASDLIDDNEVVSTVEDTTLTGNVLTNASSPDGPLSVTDFTVDGTTYVIGTTASLTEGDLTLNSDGSYTFVPSTDYNGGVPVVTYTVTDGAGDTDISTLTISVGAASDLIDDNEVVSTVEDTTLTGNVLTNASSPDGPLSVTDFTVDGTTYVIGTTASLTEGDLTLNSDGSYTFVPSTDYNGGVPVVTYTVTDGAGDTDISTLTISVGAASDLIDDNEVVSTVEDTTLTGNVLTNASSPDGPLSVTDFTVDGTTYVIGTTASLTEGDLTLNSDGSYTFVPSTDYNGGVPVVTYTVTDGAGDTDISTLTISVESTNIEPVAENDGFNIDEGESVSGNVITHNDGDGLTDHDGGDGSTLTITQINNVNLVFGVDGFATVPVDGGILRINADGDFTYENSEGFVLGAGYPSFVYTLSDGTDIDTATVTISVNDSAPVAVNDNNVIGYKDIAGMSVGSGVRGSIITRGSSGDRVDTSADGTIILTQIEYDGDTFIFDALNTSYTIITDFGVLAINDVGLYTFILDSGVDVNTIPSSLQFTYTIQDGDTVNPETDDATLTINLAHNDQSISTTSSMFSDGGLIDLSNSEPIDNVKLNQGNAKQSIKYDLSDLLVEESIDGFDASNILNEFSEKNSLSTDQESETPAVLGDDIITLESIEQLDPEKIVTNDLLNKGATLISDVSLENVPQQIELDSTDHL